MINKKYKIQFTKEAAKDTKKLSPKLKKKLKEILTHKIFHEPYSGKKLLGDLQNMYSVHLSYQDRIIYSINEKSKVVIIHRTKTHYGN